MATKMRPHLQPFRQQRNLPGDVILQVNETVIQAGRTLSLRFKEKGQYLRSFVADESLFIDIMMNAGIIFYAAQEMNDSDLQRKAMQHCLTTRKYLVRGDGSTSHEGIFNTETGEFLRQSTHQGWRDDSSWARGLTWALYGFGTAYYFTRDVRFLQTSEACADYYIERTPEHGVAPNDWDEPEPQFQYESSPAAIAASGAPKKCASRTERRTPSEFLPLLPLPAGRNRSPSGCPREARAFGLCGA